MSIVGLTLSRMARVWRKRHCQTQVIAGYIFDLATLFLEMYPKENDWICV